MKTYRVDASRIPGRSAEGPAPLRERLRHILRSLQMASAEYGLKERHLAVLDMLGSFLQELGPEGEAIVFASNQAMSERARGMDIQRIQRVMRDLIEKRLVIRRSSPNGKRYVRRDMSGQIRAAFGIDLGPLFERENEFRDARERAQARELRRRMLRDELSLLRMSFTPESDTDIRIRKLLRRRGASVEALEALLRDLAPEDAQEPALPSKSQSDAVMRNTDQEDETEKPTLVDSSETTPDAHQFDMHHQRVIQNNIDKKRLPASETRQRQGEPLVEVLHCNEVAEACPKAMEFTPESPKDWRDLVRYAQALAPMIGIPDKLSRKAQERFGLPSYSAVILCLVERYGPQKIRNPAGYLTRLLAEEANFNPVRFLRGTAKLTAMSALSA